MNRRQFLTGVSAAAVASALPAAPVTSPVMAIDWAVGESVSVMQLYWRGRMWWITGKDNVIHYSELCDPAWFVPNPEWVDTTYSVVHAKEQVE